MENSIFTPDMTFVNADGSRQTNTVILFHGHKISIAMDDSHRRLENLLRTDIRISQGDEDVTESIIEAIRGESILSSSDDLFDVMLEILRRKSR
jgi:hypothetical protein